MTEDQFVRGMVAIVGYAFIAVFLVALIKGGDFIREKVSDSAEAIYLFALLAVLFFIGGAFS